MHWSTLCSSSFTACPARLVMLFALLLGYTAEHQNAGRKPVQGHIVCALGAFGGRHGHPLVVDAREPGRLVNYYLSNMGVTPPHWLSSLCPGPG